MIKGVLPLNAQNAASVNAKEISKKGVVPDSTDGPFQDELKSTKKMAKSKPLGEPNPLGEIKSNLAHTRNPFDQPVTLKGFAERVEVADEKGPVAPTVCEELDFCANSAGLALVPLLAKGTISPHTESASLQGEWTTVEKESASQVKAAANGQLANAKARPAVTILEQVSEKSGRNDPATFPVRQPDRHEVPVGKGIGDPGLLPTAPSIPLGNTTVPDQRLLPVLASAAFDWTAPNSGNTIAQQAVSAANRILPAYIDISARPMVQPLALRIHIDDPVLGKISARFDSRSDTISMSLTSHEGEMPDVISEVNQEMKIWLEQTKIASSDKPEATEMTRDNAQLFSGTGEKHGHADKYARRSADATARSDYADDSSTGSSSSYKRKQDDPKWRKI